MYAWQSRSRLTPLRMYWLAYNPNDPKYELVKYRKPNLRRHPYDLRGMLRVEHDRDCRHRYPRADDGMVWGRRPKRR